MVDVREAVESGPGAGRHLRTWAAVVASKLELFEDHLVAVGLEGRRAIGGFCKEEVGLVWIALGEISRVLLL